MQCFSVLKSDMSDDKSRLVYSTEKNIPKKETSAVKSLPDKSSGGAKRLIVRLDRKKRAGKSVTLVEGLSLSIVEMEALLKQIKADRGTGGTLKEGVLEIQGDHCDAVIAFLELKGFKPKRSGG
jgi:translation initiation factor 1